MNPAKHLARSVMTGVPSASVDDTIYQGGCKMAAIRTMRRFGSLAAVLTGSVAALMVLPVYSSPRAAAAVADNQVPTIPPAAYLADAINNLGLTSFSASFAGARVDANSSITLFTVANPPTAFQTAVNALNLSNIPVAWQVVQASADQLDAATNALDGVNSTLLANGIDLREFGPDPTTGTLRVVLSEPTAADLSLASHFLQTPGLDESNYAAAVQHYLQSVISPFADVSADLMSGTITNVSRTADTSPFNGGDSIQDGSYICTSGFGMHGNVSGAPYELTAGHCGYGQWLIGSTTQPIGTTATDYYGGSSHVDVQTIAGRSYSDLVYGGPPDSSTSYTVTGVFSQPPAIDSPIAFSGARTGESEMYRSFT